MRAAISKFSRTVSVGKMRRPPCSGQFRVRRYDVVVDPRRPRLRSAGRPTLVRWPPQSSVRALSCLRRWHRGWRRLVLPGSTGRCPLARGPGRSPSIFPATQAEERQAIDRQRGYQRRHHVALGFRTCDMHCTLRFVSISLPKVAAGSRVPGLARRVEDGQPRQEARARSPGG